LPPPRLQILDPPLIRDRPRC